MALGTCSNQRSRFRQLRVSILGAVFALGCAQSGDKALVVGAVLPMTGDAATFGQNAARGAELAIRDFNARRQRGSREAVLKVEDSRGTASDAVIAATKLIDVDGATMLLGDVTSAGTRALFPIIKARDVALVSPSASDPALSGASPLFARVWPSDVAEAGVIASYAKKRGYHRIAVIFANTDYGTAMVRQFQQEAPADTIGPVIPMERQSPDFRPSIDRVKASRADALFMVLYPEDARRLLVQAERSGFSMPILATATFEDPTLVKVPLSRQVVFASPIPADSLDSLRVDFTRQYRAAFQADPGVLSDAGYDAVSLMLHASANKSVSGSAVIGAIRAIQDYHGVSGRLTFDANGDVQKPYGLRVVRDGRFVWTSDPTAKP